MFWINWVEFYAILLKCRIDQISPGNQGFLVGQGDIFMVIDGVHGRNKTAESNQGIFKKIVIFLFYYFR